MGAIASTSGVADLHRKIIEQASKCGDGKCEQRQPDAAAAAEERKEKSDISFFANEDCVRNDMRRELLDDVAEKWNIAPPAADASAEKPTVLLPKKDACGGELFDKINGIFIAQMKFVNTPLSHAIEALANAAYANDKNSDEDNRGVNIVLLGATAADEPVVNLSLKNISLHRLIELVAKSVSYKFDIANDAVIFYRANMADDIVETQIFPMSRATLIRLTGLQGINHHAHKNSDAAETMADEERAIKDFFQRAGVNFKDIPGSDLAFDGSQIIVTNTGRNLRKIDCLLKKYSEVKQVEIEAKFLEVQQGVLDELGFRWQFGDRKNADNGFFRTGRPGQSTDSDKIDNLRSLSDAFASTNFSRGNGTIVSAENNATTIPNQAPNLPLQVNLGAVSVPLGGFTGVLNRVKCDVIVKALEQHAGSDLMSAPKITVLSGKTAEITVAMELRYPRSYGDTHSEVGVGSSGSGTSSAGVTITAGTPQDFATRNVGVEMSVTPIVEADSSISLQLEPKVTEFEGFVEYGGSSIGISSGITATIPSGFYQPIFSTREIHTEVNILDGSTVVMGGLTREEVKEVHDKVPILGDIPLLGRLFRSDSETSQKRNLLIFVTAHTVPPCGDGSDVTIIKKPEKHSRSGGERRPAKRNGKFKPDQ
ncbi:MAG: hypothetical protein LBT64_02050 [Puniceicoccales bacterium]|jgi:general secretion pathway protein D|nr:hypothetical protein [Puniceicoccales bacterium]